MTTYPALAHSTNRPGASLRAVPSDADLLGDDEARSAFARTAHARAGEPSRWLPVVGVTGTKASEFAARFLRSILEADGRRVGVVDADRGGADGLADDLATILDRGCDLAIAHVSADGLAGRVADGLSLEVALVVTDGDTTRDEVRAFARMARLVRPGGVIAIDDADAEANLIPASNLHAQVATFGLSGGADFSAAEESGDLAATRLRLFGLDRERAIDLPPLGAGVVQAALGATAVARALGATDGAIVAGLEAVAFDAEGSGPISPARRFRHAAPGLMPLHERRAG